MGGFDVLGLVRRAVWLVVLVVAAAVPASSQAATLAPTPYMGWNTYYGVGGVFNETTIKDVANKLISSGLVSAGYNIVWLDYGWASGARDASGNLIVDTTNQWPGGMTALTSWLHSQGLLAGIYTDAGTSGCSGKGVGSYGHYQQDINQFAAWGFDAIKVDFCGAGQQWLDQPPYDPRTLYGQFAQAVAAAPRPMILNVCNFWTPGQIDGTNPTFANSSYENYSWAPQIAQSWRTDTDIGFGGGRGIAWSAVLRNMTHDAAHPAAASPGHWNDPDYLGPGLGMTDTEAQAQFSMWAMLAAPLILGSDPRNLTQAQIGILKNVWVIGIDQDTLGALATMIQASGTEQVWSKPLANGDRAVALLNTGTSSAQISTTAQRAGLPQANGYQFYDLWSGTVTPTDSAGNISPTVPAHGVALYRVSPSSGGSPPPSGAVTLTTTTAGSGGGTVSDGQNISSCQGTCSAQYPDGTQLTLTATPSPGSRFAGWAGGGCSGSAPCTFSPNSDMQVTATFVAQQTLSVSMAGPGTGVLNGNPGSITCPGACAESYDRGSTVTLTATPSSGSAFAGWAGGGCSGTGGCTVTVNSDTAVTARFIQLRTLSVSVIGAGAGTITAPGISCPGTCSASYPAGDQVTLTAHPAGGSQFGAWLSGPCRAAASSCTLPMDSDATLTSAFDRSRSGTAYVVSTSADTVTPIDLATNTVGPSIGGLNRPGAIAISPTGGTGYVVNRGGNAVRAIDLATNSLGPVISGLRRPGPITVAPDGRTGYVLEDGRRLVPIDLMTDQAEPPLRFAATSGVGNDASALAMTPNGKTAYLGTFTYARGRFSGSVARVSLPTGRVTGVIGGFADPRAIAIEPRGGRAYVADSSLGNVTPINLVTNRRLSAPALTAPGAFPGADALTISPSGSTVYVADQQGVGAIATATNRPQPLGLTVFGGSGGVALTPDGATVYATAGGGVLPLDLATDTARPALTGISESGAIAIALVPSLSARLYGPAQAPRRAVTDTVSCLSMAAPCAITQTLTIAHTRTLVVLGRRTITIAPGATRSVRMALNAAGRRILARGHGVSVLLSLAIRRGAHDDTIVTRRLLLRP